jgi:hypothetical protein
MKEDIREGYRSNRLKKSNRELKARSYHSSYNESINKRLGSTGNKGFNKDGRKY